MHTHSRYTYSELWMNYIVFLAMTMNLYSTYQRAHSKSHFSPFFHPFRAEIFIRANRSKFRNKTLNALLKKQIKRRTLLCIYIKLYLLRLTPFSKRKENNQNQCLNFETSLYRKCNEKVFPNLSTELTAPIFVKNCTLKQIQFCKFNDETIKIFNFHVQYVFV